MLSHVVSYLIVSWFLNVSTNFAKNTSCNNILCKTFGYVHYIILLSLVMFLFKLFDCNFYFAISAFFITKSPGLNLTGSTKSFFHSHPLLAIHAITNIYFYMYYAITRQHRKTNCATDKEIKIQNVSRCIAASRDKNIWRILSFNKLIQIKMNWTLYRIACAFRLLCSIVCLLVKLYILFNRLI